MARASEAPIRQRTAEDCLLDAVRSTLPDDRLRFANEGLALTPLAPTTELLLWRQVYTARLERRRFRQALEAADRMIAVGVLRDIAFHDAARAHAALGDFDRAIAMQRLAARASHPVRRSFHRWSLATLQHFAGYPDDALSTLTRAMRCSTRDRALLQGHALYVRLESGRPVRGAERIVTMLRESASREGYGRFLLGMIAYHQGDHATARQELGVFVARHQQAEPARAITLREELRRARVALGRVLATPV
jgi:tetratricopeptide (TPR) repeat protein